MACPRRPRSAGPQVRCIEVCLFGDGVARSMRAGSDGPPPICAYSARVTGQASLRLDARRLDDARVLVDFAAHETGELFRRHVHGVVAEVAESLTHARIRERLARVRGDLRYYIRRRAGGSPDAEPQGRIRPRDPRFARGRNFRQLAVALRCTHGERPHPAALEVRY